MAASLATYISSLEITHLLPVDFLCLVSLVLNLDLNPSTARRPPYTILRQLLILYITRISGYTHYEPWDCFIRHHCWMSQQKYVAMFSSDKIHRPHAYLYQVTEAKTSAWCSLSVKKFLWIWKSPHNHKAPLHHFHAYSSLARAWKNKIFTW